MGTLLFWRTSSRCQRRGVSGVTNDESRSRTGRSLCKTRRQSVPPVGAGGVRPGDGVCPPPGGVPAVQCSSDGTFDKAKRTRRKIFRLMRAMRRRTMEAVLSHCAAASAGGAWLASDHPRSEAERRDDSLSPHACAVGNRFAPGRTTSDTGRGPVQPLVAEAVRTLITSFITSENGQSSWQSGPADEQQ
jgi:hypothetical protein